MGDREAGQTGRQQGMATQAIHAGEIRAMYILGENPAMSDPDQAHARSALAKLEHLVVQDIFLTETAWHADVVLPASAHPEKTGTFTNTDRRVQLGRQALDPPVDARQDLAIIIEIAGLLGGLVLCAALTAPAGAAGFATRELNPMLQPVFLPFLTPLALCSMLAKRKIPTTSCSCMPWAPMSRVL